MTDDYHDAIEPWLYVDASAAIGVAQRTGLGKIRHLETGSLWLQEAVRKKQIGILKVKGTENPSDLMTKFTDFGTLDKLSAVMGLEVRAGRAEVAPEVAGSIEDDIEYVGMIDSSDYDEGCWHESNSIGKVDNEVNDGKIVAEQHEGMECWGDESMDAWTDGSANPWEHEDQRNSDKGIIRGIGQAGNKLEDPKEENILADVMNEIMCVENEVKMKVRLNRRKRIRAWRLERQALRWDISVDVKTSRAQSRRLMREVRMSEPRLHWGRATGNALRQPCNPMRGTAFGGEVARMRLCMYSAWCVRHGYYSSGYQQWHRESRALLYRLRLVCPNVKFIRRGCTVQHKARGGAQTCHPYCSRLLACACTDMCVYIHSYERACMSTAVTQQRHCCLAQVPSRCKR